ncbi:MAG: hypothetical protein KF893_11865 [Caldilineaceae bacterium]|nr:hypothetical protein [Caldilineaceae bacterium]
MATQAELIARAKQRQQEKATTTPSAGSPVDLLDTQATMWGSILGSLLGMGVAASGIAVAVGMIGVTENNHSFWYLSRSSGIVAYLLLWVSVAWGLLLTTRLGKHLFTTPQIVDAHQFLSNLGLGFAFFHGLILMGDQYLSFPLSAVLIPFVGDYAPMLVAAGQIGLWLLLLMIVSFYLRRWIGAKSWRLIHYLSFAGYWLVLIHALLLGSDSGYPLIAVMYTLTVAAVIFLSFYRIFARRGD